MLLAVFSPALAAGAAVGALAVPLLIHLLFRKRYQIVPWAAIRFLMAAEQRRRRRIDQWLLLALRMLGLLLPLLAMIAATRWAEPLWQSIKPGATETISNVPRTHHVLVIDATLSMTGRTEGGQTRFEKAIAEAESLVRTGSPGDGYTVLALTGGLQAVAPGPSNDPDKVIAEIKKLKPTHSTGDTATALPMVADVLARSPRAYPRRQVTFFTDAQRSAWANALPKPDAPPPEVWQRIFARAEVALVDVAQLDAANLAVADVALIDPVPLIDSPVIVSTTVVNYSSTEWRNVRLQLLIGRPSAGSEALAPIQQGTIDAIQPGGRASFTFGIGEQIRFREKGLHILQVKLMESDELAADDSRSLAVQVRDGLRAVLVDGSADPVPLRRSSGYLARALFPPDARLTDTPARPRVMTPAEFADPAVGDLSNVDCVYLCDLPNPTLEIAAKLDLHLKRGGGVVIGLGPNAAANIPLYNKVFFNDGNGILPGAIGDPVSTSSPDDTGFRFTADDEAYRRPPLQPFRDENVRAGLTTAPFKTYLKIDAPPDGRARRILSFASVVPSPEPAMRKPDAALIEWARQRGRVIVFTSSFNDDWNDWPPLPTYLPFQQELLRYAASTPDRHTLQVGDVIEDYFSPAAVGNVATLTGPEGLSVSLPVATQDEVGVVRFADVRLSGLYRLKLEGQPERVFAVNVPESPTGTGSESDLKRIDFADLKRRFESMGPVQTVSEVAQIVPASGSDSVLVSTPKPHGPMIARVLVLVALMVMLIEMAVAWRWGPARAAGAGTTSGSVRNVERKWYLRIVSSALAFVPLALALALLGTLVHYERTGNLLGFLPADMRHSLEVAAGVPAAQPGEGTKWRLEGFTTFVRNALLDRRLVLSLAAFCLIATVVVYRYERRAVAGYRRLVLPGLLRLSAVLLALFVLMPQLRLAFDREGWPEIAILLDTSASMSTSDYLKDPAVRAKAEELAGVGSLPHVQRLKLAQLLLTRKDADWLDRLLSEKEVKVHIYTIDSALRPITSLNEPADAESGRAAIMKLTAQGDSSRLGEGVERVLQAFQGGSLAAIIMMTDGVTTAGDDLPKAAREASRAGVPLFLIGVGDAWETPDLELTDLQAEDTVTVGDRLVFEARLLSRGQTPTDPLPIVLYEKVHGQLVERGRSVVTPNSSGAPVPVTIAYSPMEPGEKTFVLVAPTVAGEVDTANNKLERTVLVTDAKRLRVLYIEGYPRYDFRFVKVLLERESERSAGGKGVQLEVLLLDAAMGWAETDRSAFRGDFPTREQLFGYDVVVLGDVDPRQLPRAMRTLQDLADFVRIKGGGLLFLRGEHSSPTGFVDTPLAEVLPVAPTQFERSTKAKDAPGSEAFQPKLTELGRQHSLFRFAPDETESANIWNKLPPLYWYSPGYRVRPNTSVLAVHPRIPAEGGKVGEGYPLVIHAHVGAGSVLFLGFDDTWRWRFRNFEEYFDRFWIQAVRVLSRTRIRRVELKVTPKATFRRDEKMTVVVRFPVEAPAPPPGQPVRVTLSRSPLGGPNGSGAIETTTLTLARMPGPGIQYETTLTRTPEGDYRFTLVDPEPQPGLSAPTASVQVLPPLSELDRVDMNIPDLASAAAISSGGFYTLATADKVFDDLKNLQRVPLNQPCPPIEIWNHPAIYLLLLMLLTAEWLLRKRERLL